MANLSEDIQCVGSDTRPPMLDRTNFASWKQRIRLYCPGKENGVNILKSIDEGPFQMGTFWGTLAEGNERALHLGPEQHRVYSDLSPKNKERYNADIRATNILLQGLPKDIYSLINHYIDAKDIWDNVKMLLEGSELTKEDRESQLYDDFEHFRQHKGETIHDYYVRFAKLINDMRNIKMTMSRMQLNFKVDRIEDRVTMHGVQVQLVMRALRIELGMLIQVQQGRPVFMANLSSGDPVNDEAIMHDDVHPNYVVDSHADYTSDSNMISYDQYIKDNAVPVV
ncbi:hypothetical protein Tco_0132681 [Tanacetum coccineum]